MEFLYSLEESALGMAVSSSIWGYPIVLSLHALGMAILVGISLMLCIRTIGFATQIPFASLTPYWRLAMFGFVVNLLSGTALFFGSASSLAENWPFRIKIILMVLGLFLTQRTVKHNLKEGGTMNSTARIYAVLAIFVWIGALISGRLIGYVF